MSYTVELYDFQSDDLEQDIDEDESEMEEPDKLQWSESAFCCGIIEIGSFGNFYAYSDNAVSPPTLEKKQVENNIQTMQSNGFPLLATLVDYQWNDFEEILKKMEFKTIAETRNPNTARQIRTYMWLPDRKENKYVFA